MPVIASATSTATNVTGILSAGGRSRIASERQQSAEREGDSRRERGLPRTDQILLIDVQLHLQVGGEGIVRGELRRHLPRGRLAESPLAVERGELVELLLRHLAQLAASPSR